MRATLNIPDHLIEELQKITGNKSKTRAIVIAMEDFIRKKKIEKLLALKGRVEIEDVTGELEQLEIKEMGKHDKKRRSH